MTTRVSSKGQIVLPSEIRAQDDIKPGQEFVIERISAGKYRLTRKSKRPNQGVVKWLLSCPVKDFYVPFESEGIQTL